MASTSHGEFQGDTEGLEVARAFADGVRGKTIIVTGANLGGIGFTTAQAFASQGPAHLILTGRNTAKVQKCIDALQAEYPDVDYRILQLDLASQKAVRKAADEVLGWSDIPAIDIVVNSAGVMLIPERTLSEDGIEMQFATNHIGHYLFTCLIMPKLIKAAQNSPRGATRIVNVSSGSPQVATMRWSDLNFDKVSEELPDEEKPPYEWVKLWGTTEPEKKAYIPVVAYNSSKVANVLFGVGLNNRLYDKYGIVSIAVHPGVIKTELARNAAPETAAAINDMLAAGLYSFKTQGAGASTSLVAALDPRLGVSVGESKDGQENYGAYLDDCQISTKALPSSVSNANAERLWTLSEELVKQKFAW
ncbi:hypothetical protein S7711_02910 [Stachybotrys chartarum IBT 7711]|uniref:Ketoreductase domain-containing protein n=1 Tax=Stachybotrys chartarum (strain CBS 109288 / IBT 7711) TaxID=1280523 RepID=A0A084B296_STACB|nr:hypothetical protein S7711_02910 [Stachybotrys chartarum IBT 7711]